jgi:uncharacterized protein (TIGR03067 family)
VKAVCASAHWVANDREANVNGIPGFALVVILVPSAPALKDGSDQTSLQGDWEVVGCTIHGHKVPQEQVGQLKVTVFGDKFQLSPLPVMTITPPMQVTFTFTPGAVEYRFLLEGKSGTKSIDLIRTMDGLTHLLQGIYRLDGDRLVICYRGGDRPKEFQSGEKDGSWMFELRRSKR